MPWDLPTRKRFSGWNCSSKDLNIQPEDRVSSHPRGRRPREAQEQNKGNEGIYCGAAIELKDGTIITGNNSPLMHAASSLVLHAIKHLADIPDKITLLPGAITDSVRNLKTDILNEKSVSLDLEETLIALSISATTNPAAQTGHGKTEGAPELRGPHHPHAHARRRSGTARLGVNLTSEPNFSTKDLFMP